MMNNGDMNYNIIQLGSGKRGRKNDDLNLPYSLCYDNNNLYVADYQNHRIQVFDKYSGEYHSTIGSTGSPGFSGMFNYPISLCIDKDNSRLFILDYSNHRIEVYSTESGKYVLTICGSGTSGTDNNQLNYPQGICLASSTGILYVADTKNHRIQLYDSCTGSYVNTFGVPGISGSEEGHFHSPVSICVDEHSNYLYVSEWDNDRVQILDATTGEFKGMIGDVIKDENIVLMEEEEIDDNKTFKSPYGLTIDRDSNLLYVVDAGNLRIQVFTLDTWTYSKTIDNFQITGSDLTLLRDPREICIDNVNHNMFLCDAANHRILVLKFMKKNSVNVRSVPIRQPLLAAMASIVNTDIYSDITIIVDGERLPAHRIFLFTRSKYFRDILNGDETNKIINNEIQIQENGLSPDMMRELLHFMYTDHCTDDTILYVHGRALLLLAIKFEIHPLIREVSTLSSFLFNYYYYYF